MACGLRMYILAMSTKSRLQSWMSNKGLRDNALAKLTGVSRVQINRIRRGTSGARKDTAMRLHAATGIHWRHFIEPGMAEKKPRKRVSA